MSDYPSLFTPFRLKSLTLRNRIFSSSHAPALAEDGAPKDRYQRYHLEKAKGGIGMTMFGGSSSVAFDSPLVFSQISLADDTIIPHLKQFSERIHAEGAALMCQMSHMGRRGEWDHEPWLPLIAPTASREGMHRSWSKEMEDFDFDRVRDAYAAAGRRLKDGGLDGLEICGNAHHLFDTFLSPLLNRRSDRYGGSTEARMRFPLEILAAVRDAVGPEFIMGLRLTADDLVKGGFDAREAMEVSVAFAESGLIDFLNVFQGHGDYGKDLREMMPDMDFDSAPFLYLASAVKAQIDIPVFHATGIRDLATAERAVAGGHVDLVGMTRAHMADPHLIAKLMAGREEDIRQCIGSNYCIDRVGQGKHATCIQNVSIGREATIPHIITPGEARRRVMVVGGGPAGLETARSALSRGHAVTLVEKADILGGQMRLSHALGWRANMQGIGRWLEAQVRQLGGEIRTGTEATPALIEAEAPDVVVIATGGRPAPLQVAGAEHITTTHDLLSGRIEPGENVLVYDETGQHQGVSAADFAASRGALVEIVTPDQMVGEEVGGTARASYMNRLYRQKAIMTVSHKLSEIYPEGNRLIAVLRELHSGVEVERAVTQIIAELGTLPVDELYFALKPLSRNNGELDQRAFVALQPQTLERNPEGRFQLFRIGDALMSRNIHAAIYDGARLGRAL